jgi:uncharacterized protein YndB with AHSA1/START domain
MSKMETKVQEGYILLADISGFDAYLSGVELDHAQGVLQELLELIVDSLQPPMELASIKGDAVLVHVPASRLTRGETLLELTETAYVAFRDRVKSIHRNNTCQCRACQAVPSLDLKFFVHYGEYTAEPISAGGVELGGLDANLVRQRLLKDQVSSANGWRAYTLFTGPSLEKMGLRPDGMHTSCASYPHMGEIETAAMNLQPRYEALTEERHAYVAADEADIAISEDFGVPPPVLWDWLNDPAKRSQWLKWTSWRAGLRPGGRTGIGARNHCAHGIGTVIETILDWRPYEYFTAEMEEKPGSFYFLVTYELEPLPNGDGTRLHVRSRVHRGPVRWLVRGMAKLAFPLKLKGDFERMTQLMSRQEAAAG